MKCSYRIIRSLKTLEYRVQYTYLGFWWSDCTRMAGPRGRCISEIFNSLTQAEDYVTKQRQIDHPDKWEVVRTYG